jgi:Cytochrome c7 and related cytochrome c
MDHPNAEKRLVPSNRGEVGPSGTSRWGALAIVVLIFGLAFFGAFRVARTAEKSVLEQIAGSPVQTNTGAASTGVSAVFTPAHRTLFGAVKEFLLWQSTPVQPIAFNHKIHIQHGLQCTNCHTGATQGPDAGIPSVSFCMACHQVIAASNPEIKKLSAYAAKGQEPPWQRVFWFYPSVHVKFWHSPHIRAGVSCEQCHGDIAQETVAVKTKDLTMKFCLSCHNAKGVSVDCTTCHY